MNSFDHDTRNFWESLHGHFHYIGKLPKSTPENPTTYKSDMEWTEWTSYRLSQPCVDLCYPFDESATQYSEEERLKKKERIAYLTSLFGQ